MRLVRTNLTIPEDVLAKVDAVAGPRGRSRYIADIVARQVKRDHAKVFEETAGVLKDSDTWGPNAPGDGPDPSGASRRMGRAPRTRVGHGGVR